MPACSRCQRPVALSRSTCLYCGAALAGAPREAAPAAEPDAPPAGAFEGLLLGFWPETASASVLAAALGIDAYEARQRVARGGAQLWRLLDEAQARAEAARLQAAGLEAWLLAGQAVRASRQPRLVAGGSFEQGRLQLRLDGQSRRTLEAGELLLVVRGPIARQHQHDPQARSRARAANPAPCQPGYRFHLHLRESGPPFELDPASFEFADTQAGRAPYLSLHRWTTELGAPVDDSFRHLTPALGPSQPEAGRATSWLASLEAERAGKQQARTLLDNLAQFRFFSAWRGLLERERRAA